MEYLFIGYGKSKKVAKRIAAYKMCKVVQENFEIILEMMNKPQYECKLETETRDGLFCNLDLDQPKEEVKEDTVKKTNRSKTHFKTLSKDIFDDSQCGSTINKLQEMCMSRSLPHPSYKLVGGPGYSRRHVYFMSCTVLEHEVTGKGLSVRLAKRMAAQKMYEKLFKELPEKKPNSVKKMYEKLFKELPEKKPNSDKKPLEKPPPTKKKSTCKAQDVKPNAVKKADTAPYFL